MWQVTEQPVENGHRYTVRRNRAALSYEAVLAAWRDQAAFRVQFIQWLAASPYDAFRWETPPLTAATARQPFEYVLLHDPALQRKADPSDFAEHLQNASDDPVTFANLGGDAQLIVPRNAGARADYAHLAAFSRSAPLAQQHALWQRVSDIALHQLNTRPLWLNTAGAGVPWLHIRLDRQPKYYRHAPYRTLAG